MTDYNMVFNSFYSASTSSDLYKKTSKKLFDLLRANFLISPVESWKSENVFGSVESNKVYINIPTEVHNKHNFSICYVVEFGGNGKMEIYRVLSNCFHTKDLQPIRKSDEEKQVLFEKIFNVLSETNKQQLCADFAK